MSSNGHDPNADFGELWAAAHDYLICQNAADGAALAQAYTRFLEAHNMIHERYVATGEIPVPIAGVE